MSNELAPLKVWQFQELSIQAAERIMSAPKDEALKVLINIVQNFPTQVNMKNNKKILKLILYYLKLNNHTMLFFLGKRFGKNCGKSRVKKRDEEEFRHIFVHIKSAAF